MQTRSIGKTSFTVDNVGRVSSTDFDDLGDLEDCEAFAELVWHLFDTLYPDLTF
jgi:hypothetical protein